MDRTKLYFLSHELIPRLKDLPADAQGQWGKMNGQQMVEHLSGFFKVSTEKIKYPLVTPVEHLPRFRDFLFSEKEFRENTQAPVNIVPEEPVPLRKKSMTEALDELQREVRGFIDYFTANPERKTYHPVFGELNFEEWVLLHYKHVSHHLRQFNRW